MGTTHFSGFYSQILVILLLTNFQHFIKKLVLFFRLFLFLLVLDLETTQQRQVLVLHITHRVTPVQMKVSLFELLHQNDHELSHFYKSQEGD